MDKSVKTNTAFRVLLYHDPQNPIFSTKYSVMCKVNTGFYGTSETEHGLCACTVVNPSLKLGIISSYRRTNHALSLTKTLRPKLHTVLSSLSFSIITFIFSRNILKRLMIDFSISADVSFNLQMLTAHLSSIADRNTLQLSSHQRIFLSLISGTKIPCRKIYRF